MVRQLRAREGRFAASSPSTKRAIRLASLLVIGGIYAWFVWQLIPWSSGHRYANGDRAMIACIVFALSFGPLFVGCIAAELPMEEYTRTLVLQISFFLALVLPGLLKRSSWPADRIDVPLVYQLPTAAVGVLAAALAIWLVRRATK
jgi:hypothetical protein